MNRKYRILYSLSEFMHGSKVRQVCQLVRGLNKDLFETEICAESIVDEASNEIESLNIPYFISPLFPPRSFKVKKLFNFLMSPVFLNKKKYDLVHSLHYSSLCFEAIICALSKECKFIYSKSNLQWDNHRVNWNLKSRFSKNIITQSKIGFQLLADKGFSNKATIIYNGIDCREYFPAPDREKQEIRKEMGIGEGVFVFGYAAHFVEVKDHITLIKAFKIQNERYPNSVLALCGGPHDAAYYNNVLDYISNNNLSRNVYLLGTLTDMKKFYTLCDCLIFTSKFENFSIVILEALSSGLPVIASKFGGNIEQVDDNVNGFLVDPGDHVGFADAMSRYLNKPELVKIHGAESRKIAETRYSVEVMVKKTEELYLDLLQK